MQESTPLVSVVIATYQSDATIIQAIDSVFKQTYLNIELIVVDDGSTDTTESLVRPLAQAGKLTYLKQENRGCGAARNAGMAQAHGTYVAFLDSDDYWQPEKIARQIAVFETDPNCVLCYTEAILIDQSRAVIGTAGERGLSHLRSGNLTLVLPLRNPLTLSSAMARMDMVRSVGGFIEDRELMMFADYGLWLMLAPRGSFVALSEPLTYYEMRNTPSAGAVSANHWDMARVLAIAAKRVGPIARIAYIFASALHGFRSLLSRSAVDLPS